MAIFVTSSTRDTKTKSTYRRPKWSEYYEENFSQLQIENYTCSTRLWLSYFISDNKHTFGKQIPPDLPMLLAFSVKTVDRLDKIRNTRHKNWRGEQQISLVQRYSFELRTVKQSSISTYNTQLLGSFCCCCSCCFCLAFLFIFVPHRPS